MQKAVHTVNQGINNLAYYWSFPEIVAHAKGCYKNEGISVVFHDITPSEVVPNKSEMYKELQKEGKQDAYHAAEYVCITRAISNTTGKIVAYSPWVKNGLNASFGLYVKPNAGIKIPADLKGKSIAIEKGTGSYYTTIEDLEKSIPREQIKLTQIGDPHLRLEALVRGEVAAASVMGPYADLAERIGMVKLMESSRRKGTLMIVKNDIDSSTLAAYIRATNKAIHKINTKPDEHRALYFKWFSKIIPRLVDELRSPVKKMQSSMTVPKWKEWEKYSKSAFEDIYGWMVDRKLVEAGHKYEELVDLRSFR
ncbi:MAG: ABC transporter substrate-binding protein [Thaumarchaeota archaeon]|nr:ABC transporter substrate-binding protein [Nitrososphaerota archaeon]